MPKGVQPREAVELAIIVPTYKEEQNIQPLLQRLEAALSDVAYEVIFVDDDSPDGTADRVREISRRRSWVRVIQRVGRRGLASACLEGLLSTSAPYLAVMDADLQHDERILPQMLARMRTGKYDLVIGSRNIEGGSMGEFARERVALSNLGLSISKIVSKHDLSDPMSGFFMLTQEFLQEVAGSATGVGFKILLDLVASSSRPVRFTEVPYRFRSRERGESKLDINVGIEYLYLVADKSVGRWLPIRFLLYCLVGIGGLTLHMTVLWALYRGMHYAFETALIVAITVALIFNFLVNNMLTFRERRRKGFGLLWGLVIYALACSVGNFGNYAMTKLLTERGVWWALAGVSGLAIGSVWNFAASEFLTWRGSSSRRAALRSKAASTAGS
jgi:dolichol-phosphate mannosyltransferase